MSFFTFACSNILIPFHLTTKSRFFKEYEKYVFHWFCFENLLFTLQIDRQRWPGNRRWEWDTNRAGLTRNACTKQKKREMTHFCLRAYSINISPQKVTPMWFNPSDICCLSFTPLFMQIGQELTELYVFFCFVRMHSNVNSPAHTLDMKSHILTEQVHLRLCLSLLVTLDWGLDAFCWNWTRYPMICFFRYCFPLCTRGHVWVCIHATELQKRQIDLIEHHQQKGSSISSVTFVLQWWCMWNQTTNIVCCSCVDLCLLSSLLRLTKQLIKAYRSY